MKVAVKKYLSVIILCALILIFLGIVFLQESFASVLVVVTMAGSAVAAIGVCGYKFVKELIRKEKVRGSS